MSQAALCTYGSIAEIALVWLLVRHLFEWWVSWRTGIFCFTISTTPPATMDKQFLSLGTKVNHDSDSRSAGKVMIDGYLIVANVVVAITDMNASGANFCVRIYGTSSKVVRRREHGPC